MADDTTPQDGKAMSPASTGSVRPFAWAVVWENDERFDRYTVSFTEQAARRHATSCPSMKSTVVPLYRLPALADSERQAIKGAIDCCEDITYGGAANQEAADVLKALLERLG